MVNTVSLKKKTGWTFIGIGLVIVIMMGLYVNDVYSGKQNLAPLFKNGAQVAQGMQIPPELLNLNGLLVYGILMLSVGTRLMNLGFQLIRESEIERAYKKQ
ncbi:MAG: hypothetical protein WC788_06300 [Candidatus Paceibacterota bacterium]|jgi:hypothetical protein